MSKKKIMKCVGSVVVLLVAAYFCVALHYKERFFVNTTINGENCESKTVEIIEGQMQKQVEEYALTITKADGTTEIIKGTDIGVEYSGVEVLKEAMDAQNPYLWVTALFQPKDIKAELAFSYDAEKLDEMIAGLECVKEENQVAPVDAKPVLAEGEDVYTIAPEVEGTLLEQEAFVAAIHEKAANMETAIDIKAEGLYVAPKYTKDSEEIATLVATLNKCLETEITYSLDGKTVTLDKETIKDWLSYDEEMNPVISSDGVAEFANSLGTTYNTAPRTQYITTPTGKTAYVSGATVGRTVGTSAECERLLTEIPVGTVTTREPIISQQATPEGQYAWGNSYAEVDIGAQHMWLILNGEVVFECDVITGVPNGKLDTPKGVFKILEKMRNKTLVGNIVPETGEPEYRQPVDYWARVTWSGVGFHDASWHSVFGGSLYYRAGSHGCINMPPASAAVFYDLVYVGCPVVIHG